MGQTTNGSRLSDSPPFPTGNSTDARVGQKRRFQVSSFSFRRSEVRKRVAAPKQMLKSGFCRNLKLETRNAFTPNCLHYHCPCPRYRRNVVLGHSTAMLHIECVSWAASR